MRTDFDSLLNEYKSNERDKKFEIEGFLYMSYWYAGFYVVIEGWQKLNLHDEVIDRLLSSSNVSLLRRYRNGAFHFQVDYFDKRFTEFMEKADEPVAWIRRLDSQFGRFF